MPRSARAAAAASDLARRITERGGRATPARTAVLQTLLEAGQPLSHDEIGARLTRQHISHDRVTLYRALDWLVNHSLAHRINGADRIWRFNAIPDEKQGHAHFHCRHCQAVYCLESLQPEWVASLPAGFVLERAELNFHGRCPKCH